MTGYGKAEQTVAKKKITIELRSVNSKTLDINLKMPPVYRERENLLRNELFRVVQRGKLDVIVVAASQDAEPTAQINKALFTAYYKQLEDVLQGVGSSAAEAGIAQAILRLPDILETTTSETSEQEWEALLECLQKALTAFDTFRINEGAALMKDILSHVSLIAALLSDVPQYETQRIEVIRQRIETNLSNLLKDAAFDKNRFEQELIYYIEKIDITEEKTRLRQHCEHFVETANNEDAPGRKLGFIAQEMGREINTLGSKANHADIQRIVVQMKDELEKIKEQLLNVL